MDAGSILQDPFLKLFPETISFSLYICVSARLRRPQRAALKGRPNFHEITVFPVPAYDICRKKICTYDNCRIILPLNAASMAKKSYQPSEAELEILNIIWELQPVTVREVHGRIAIVRDIGYTTVLKQIQRLTEKGVLDKQVRDGVHYFSATVQAAEVKQQLMEKVLHTAFGGSALDMMMHALGRDRVSAEELRAIKEWLDNQL